MTVLFKNSQTLTVARFSGRKEGQDLGLAVQTAMNTVLIRTDTGTFMGCLTSVLYCELRRCIMHLVALTSENTNKKPS